MLSPVFGCLSCALCAFTERYGAVFVFQHHATYSSSVGKLPAGDCTRADGNSSCGTREKGAAAKPTEKEDKREAAKRTAMLEAQAAVPRNVAFVKNGIARAGLIGTSVNR